MDIASWLGFVAGACTTAAFVPQVLKTWRTRSAEDVSLATFAIFGFGVLLWLVYGLYIDSWPIVIANGITLILASAMVVFTWRYRRRKVKRGRTLSAIGP